MPDSLLSHHYNCESINSLLSIKVTINHCSILAAMGLGGLPLTVREVIAEEPATPPTNEDVERAPKASLVVPADALGWAPVCEGTQGRPTVRRRSRHRRPARSPQDITRAAPASR